MIYGTCYNLQEKTTYPLHDREGWFNKQNYSGMRSDKLVIRTYNTK